MFDLRLIALPLAALAFAAVAIWAVARLRGAWRPRLVVILVLPLLTIAIWAALPSYLGWPTIDQPGGKVLVLWADIREPDPATEDPGAIFVWAVPIAEGDRGLLQALEYPREAGKPRAYELPYSRQGHEMLMRAMKSATEGRPMVLEMRPGAQGRRGMRVDPDGRQQPDADGRGDVQRDGDADFTVYDLPKASFPEKEE